MFKKLIPSICFFPQLSGIYMMNTSSTYKHESGCQKRLKKKKKLLNREKNKRTLFDVGIVNKPDEDPPTSFSPEKDEILHKSNKEFYQVSKTLESKPAELPSSSNNEPIVEEEISISMPESKVLESLEKQPLILVKNNEDVSEASKTLESEPSEVLSSSNNILIVKEGISMSMPQSTAVEDLEKQSLILVKANEDVTQTLEHEQPEQSSSAEEERNLYKPDSRELQSLETELRNLILVKTDEDALQVGKNLDNAKRPELSASDKKKYWLLKKK